MLNISNQKVKDRLQPERYKSKAQHYYCRVAEPICTLFAMDTEHPGEGYGHDA
jgi:hypothetical protein